MATCKDCLHYEACGSMLKAMGYTVDGDGLDADKRCDTFTSKTACLELLAENAKLVAAKAQDDKYNWSFDGEAEVWYNCGASVRDCIDQARDENETDNGGEYKTVFVGERVPFNIADNLDVDALLENLEESAYEFCGDAADGWDVYNPRKPAEINELREAIAPVVIGWLVKYGRIPRFCAIENVAEYDLDTGNRVGYGG